MTTNPNLSDLIKRNAALESENAALQAKLDAICDKLLANSHTITDSPKKLGITPSDKIKALSGLLHEIFGLVKHQYGHIQIKPAAEVEAPKPKFQVGDKVRQFFAWIEYPDGTFDTVTGYDNNLYSLSYHDEKDYPHPELLNHDYAWKESELIPYNDTES